ncbi:hypothetical protein C8R44DRAFT_907132 [Mycena epipterygia]|nr:hypothetical protein C8R44DRAFT_907132 [Mycena epipterygia]
MVVGSPIAILFWFGEDEHHAGSISRIASRDASISETVEMRQVKKLLATCIGDALGRMKLTPSIIPPVYEPKQSPVAGGPHLDCFMTFASFVRFGPVPSTHVKSERALLAPLSSRESPSHLRKVGLGRPIFSYTKTTKWRRTVGTSHIAIFSLDYRGLASELRSHLTGINDKIRALLASACWKPPSAFDDTVAQTIDDVSGSVYHSPIFLLMSWPSLGKMVLKIDHWREDGPAAMNTFGNAPQLREAEIHRDNVSAVRIFIPWTQLTVLGVVPTFLREIFVKARHFRAACVRDVFGHRHHGSGAEAFFVLDTRRAAEIETMIQSGNLHNPRNDVCHRYENCNARRVHTTEKAKQARVEGEELRAAEEAVATAQAHLKQIRAETSVWCYRNSLPDYSRHVVQFFRAYNRGATSDSRREGSTAPVHVNAAVSVASETVGDETLPGTTAARTLDRSTETLTVSTLTTSEHTTRPARKRSGSTSLEPDAPPKRLKLGPLKGWGVERMLRKKPRTQWREMTNGDSTSQSGSSDPLWILNFAELLKAYEGNMSFGATLKGTPARTVFAKQACIKYIGSTGGILAAVMWFPKLRAFTMSRGSHEHLVNPAEVTNFHKIRSGTHELPPGSLKLMSFRNAKRSHEVTKMARTPVLELKHHVDKCMEFLKLVPNFDILTAYVSSYFEQLSPVPKISCCDRDAPFENSTCHNLGLAVKNGVVADVRNRPIVNNLSSILRRKTHPNFDLIDLRLGFKLCMLFDPRFAKQDHIVTAPSQASPMPLRWMDPGTITRSCGSRTLVVWTLIELVSHSADRRRSVTQSNYCTNSTARPHPVNQQTTTNPSLAKAREGGADYRLGPPVADLGDEFHSTI